MAAVSSGGTVTIQLGQCGNQLGLDFFDALASASRGNPADELPAFFRHGRSDKSPTIARAALIDAEPRVVSEVVSQARAPGHSWRYQAVTEELKSVWSRGVASGSANNWAMGYNVQAGQLRDSLREAVRREAEFCDQMQDFLFMQSLAGGTGSGAGTRVSELLRDEYPRYASVRDVHAARREADSLLKSAVWPYSSGEVVIQNYNVVLSLSHLHDCSDGIICLRNDHAHEVCTRLLHINRPSFSDLNHVIADSLAKVFLPSLPLDKTDGSALTSVRVLDLAADLCPSPVHKLLSLRSIPQMPSSSHKFTNDRWSTLTKHLLQMLITDSHLSEGMDWSVTAGSTRSNRSLSNMIFLRGTGWRHAALTDLSGFKSESMYSSWAHAMVGPRVSARGGDDAGPGPDKMASLLSNSQSQVRALDHVLDHAAVTRQAGAYLHQYEKYGLSSDEFTECLAKVEQVVSDYKAL